MSSLLKRLDIIEQRLKSKTVITTKLLSGHQIEINGKVYKPSTTGLKFHRDNSTVRLMLGPYGSGKSTACCVEIIKRAIAMPPCKDGVRRSRWAIIRNTYPELKTTSLNTWLDWGGLLGSYGLNKSSPITFNTTFKVDVGQVALEIIFLSLDREADLKKLLSLELSGAYLNESRELPPSVIKHCIGRINRYPAKNDIVTELYKDYWSGVILDSNPPDIGEWLHDKFEIDRPSNHQIFHQNPAMLQDSRGNWVMNPEAENMGNLNPNYYHELVNGEDDNFVRIYACGQYGAIIEGSYYAEYMDKVRDNGRILNFKIRNDIPVHTSWDIGYNDHMAIWFWQVYNGQMFAIYYYENTQKDVPWYVNILNDIKKEYGFTYGRHFMPHDVGNNYGLEKTRAKLFIELGIIPYKVERTTNVNAGIDLVKRYMSKMWFHSDNTSLGRRVIVKYHREYDENRRLYADKPYHDYASNCADAMRTFADGWNDCMVNEKNFKPFIRRT